ncbi:unnamed protein product, partial [Scytosiphon promiscuus]
GFTDNWHVKGGKPFSRAERAAFTHHIEEVRKCAEEERQQRFAQAAARAACIWDAAEAAGDDHPYLVRKGIKANGARIHQGSLTIPVHSGGELHSLQFISENGEKRFLKGGRLAGGYFSIGTIQDANALCIAEGFATGVTIHQATGYPVAVAYSADNLELVAKAMRQKMPERPIIICADDDADTKGNPGITKASSAALAIGGKVSIPGFGEDGSAGAPAFNVIA